MHVSFSEIKIWKECSYKHKLQYLDGMKGFTGNIYTAFGSAMHESCEALLKENKILSFEEVFNKYLKELDNDIQIEQSSVEEFSSQASGIIPEVLPELEKYFGNFEVVSTETLLYEDINENIKFKGFIDLVLKTDDNKYHIIDYKTTSWGWDSKKKSDPMTNYQLTYYKYFLSLLMKIDLKDIETYFILLKRTAKKNKKVEIVRVTSGSKKIDNALKLLDTMLFNISNNKHFKNRLSCKYCEFFKKECK